MLGDRWTGEEFSLEVTAWRTFTVLGIGQLRLGVVS